MLKGTEKKHSNHLYCLCLNAWRSDKPTHKRHVKKIINLHVNTLNVFLIAFRSKVTHRITWLFFSACWFQRPALIQTWFFFSMGLISTSSKTLMHALTHTLTYTPDFRNTDVLYISSRSKDRPTQSQKKKEQKLKEWTEWRSHCSFNITVYLMQHLQSLKSGKSDVDRRRERGNKDGPVISF